MKSKFGQRKLKVWDEKWPEAPVDWWLQEEEERRKQREHNAAFMEAAAEEERREKEEIAQEAKKETAEKRIEAKRAEMVKQGKRENEITKTEEDAWEMERRIWRTEWWEEILE